jgi:hypothetical protein
MRIKKATNEEVMNDKWMIFLVFPELNQFYVIVDPNPDQALLSHWKSKYFH